jgi:hypothetical protein
MHAQALEKRRRLASCLDQQTVEPPYG